MVFVPVLEVTVLHGVLTKQHDTLFNFLVFSFTTNFCSRSGYPPYFVSCIEDKNPLDVSDLPTVSSIYISAFHKSFSIWQRTSHRRVAHSVLWLSCVLNEPSSVRYMGSQPIHWVPAVISPQVIVRGVILTTRRRHLVSNCSRSSTTSQWFTIVCRAVP
jgi:hypothetical protein